MEGLPSEGVFPVNSPAKIFRPPRIGVVLVDELVAGRSLNWGRAVPGRTPPLASDSLTDRIVKVRNRIGYLKFLLLDKGIKNVAQLFIAPTPDHFMGRLNVGVEPVRKGNLGPAN